MSKRKLSNFLASSILIFAIIVFLSVFSFVYREIQRVDFSPLPLQKVEIAGSSFGFSPLPEITLLAGGDVMLSRNVGYRSRVAGDPVYPFRYLAKELAKADITFANLESPFYNQGPRTPPQNTMVFKAEPEMIEGLIASGIDIVSLANNHFGNQGAKGELYTFDWLAKHNILYVGAGNNIFEAHQEKILERQGVKLAFLAYSYDVPYYAASTNSPGIALWDIKKAQKDIARAKEKADVVIVSLHAGSEYTHKADLAQKKFAHFIIDAGASLVLGHHPHVVQEVERYQNGLIFYSLGNLVFDQNWSQATSQGAIAKIIFSGKEIKSAEIIPIKIINNSQPQIVKEEWLRKKILKNMGLEDAIINF